MNCKLKTKNREKDVTTQMFRVQGAEKRKLSVIRAQEQNLTTAH